MKVLEAKERKENTFVKCLLDRFRVRGSSAAAGLGTEGHFCGVVEGGNYLLAISFIDKKLTLCAKVLM